MMLQVVIGYGAAAVLHLLAVVRLTVFLRRVSKKRDKVSPFLIAMLVNWLILCLLILPYEIYGVVTWRPNDSKKTV